MAIVKMNHASRFDVALSLRLLERKWLRVESNLFITEQEQLGSLGDITPSWSAEDDVDKPRLASMSIRVDKSPVEFADTDEYEGTLLHELVHAAQLERCGYGVRSSAFTEAHADPDDGSLSEEDSRTYYRIFPWERQAKALEIALVFGPANRDYWSHMLHSSHV